MSQIAYRDKAADLSIVITQHKTTPFTYMMLWKWDEVKFAFFDENNNFSLWEQGIVFGDKAQIRWRKLDTGFRIVLIADSGAAGGWNGTRDINRLANNDETYLLWGEKQFKTKNKPLKQWFDARIPHMIEKEMGYPVSTMDKKLNRVAIRIRHYTLSESSEAIQNAREKLRLKLLPLPDGQTSYLERFVEVIEK